MRYTQQKKNKITYPSWVRGFKLKKDLIAKHPYLRDDFVFDSDQDAKK